MSKNDDTGQRLPSLHNESIALPEALVRLLEARDAELDQVLSEPDPGDIIPISNKEVEARAEIMGRILEKMGIAADVQELYRLDARRNRSTK